MAGVEEKEDSVQGGSAVCEESMIKINTVDIK